MATTRATADDRPREGTGLCEVADILAAGFLRLRAKHACARKREISRDNRLEVPLETPLSVTVDRKKE
jgi:hypothetical protein